MPDQTTIAAALAPLTSTRPTVAMPPDQTSALAAATAPTIIGIPLAVHADALAALANVTHSLAPAADVDPAPVKPGWQTSEFWLKVAAMALTALFASGALTNNVGLAIAGMAASMLGAIGYTVSRTIVKTAGAVIALLVFGSMLAVQPGCAAPGTKLRAVEDGLARCTAPELQQGVSALEPTLNSVVLAATSADGKAIDTTQLDAALSKADLESDAGTYLLCAAASVFTALLSSPAPAAAAPAAAGLRIDPAALHAAFDHVRATHAPGVKFHTATGDI